MKGQIAWSQIHRFQCSTLCSALGRKTPVLSSNSNKLLRSGIDGGHRVYVIGVRNARYDCQGNPGYSAWATRSSSYDLIYFSFVTQRLVESIVHWNIVEALILI